MMKVFDFGFFNTFAKNLELSNPFQNASLYHYGIVI